MYSTSHSKASPLSFAHLSFCQRQKRDLLSEARQRADKRTLVSQTTRKRGMGHATEGSAGRIARLIGIRFFLSPSPVETKVSVVLCLPDGGVAVAEQQTETQGRETCSSPPTSTIVAGLVCGGAVPSGA